MGLVCQRLANEPDYLWEQLRVVFWISETATILEKGNDSDPSAALWAHRGFWKLVLDLVGVVSCLLNQAVVPDRLETRELRFHFVPLT
jgi:hypothetical protein